MQVSDAGSLSEQHLMNSFFPRNFKKNYPVIKSADGIWITDEDGNQYLDGCSGAIVTNLGYGVKEITDAIARQSETAPFAHTSQFLSRPALDLSGRLTSIAPPSFNLGRVYFASGGSEAVETAIKMARAYFVETDEPTRNIVMSCWPGYHGATLGALSATGHPVRRKPYMPILRPPALVHTDYRYRCQCGHRPGACYNDRCSLERADELEEAIQLQGPSNVMAFIGEPIVGAALGAAVPGATYWKRVRDICTRYGILFIADEVMTGLGRTGKPFAIQHWQVDPDILVVGKGLAAGYQPLSAVIASAKIAGAFERHSGVFEHGFTYSGHPVSCAAGLAAFDYMIENDLIRKVEQSEEKFFKRLEALRKFPAVGDVRGKGFMAGIELVRDIKTKEPFSPSLRASQMLANLAFEEGLLVYPGSGFINGSVGDHIMIAPPFVITDEELDELFARLEQAFNHFTESVKSELEASASSRYGE